MFDGDTSATYATHSNSALREVNSDAHIKNTIFYDTNNEPLTIIRHESLFSAYVLSRHLTPKKNVNSMVCNDLKDLFEEIEYYNNNLEYPVFFNNNYYPYGLCLLNKFAGFDDIIIDFTVDKNSAGNLSKKIYEDSKDNEDYHRRLSDLNKKLLYLISTTSYSPSIDIHQMINLVDDKNEKLFKKLPDKNIELGYLINESLIDRCIDGLGENSDLYLLYKSGSRFNKQQLSKTCINIGYTADADNKVIQDPIMTNLLKGMSEEDYFLGSPGTRKGLADKSSLVPDSGLVKYHSPAY
ncbi:MAG: hypothetical protein K9H48_07835 [Melioribacteraceae bacterium]|nr:hypothetical protein [Melioribacteraceae bacterium]